MMKSRTRHLAPIIASILLLAPLVDSSHASQEGEPFLVAYRGEELDALAQFLVDEDDEPSYAAIVSEIRQAVSPETWRPPAAKGIAAVALEDRKMILLGCPERVHDDVRAYLRSWNHALIAIESISEAIR